MADGTNASEIQAEMDRILGELFATADRDQVAALQRRYAQLASKLPPRGAQAGTLEIAGRRLSSGLIPPPAPVDDTDPDEESDPYLRRARELGQDWR
jgi:hypothetical protein